ncbi:MAG: RDD family protein [Acidobacteriota bacterium]
MNGSQTTLLRVAAFLVDALCISVLLVLPASIISYSLAWIGGAIKAIQIVWFVTIGILVIGLLVRDGYKGRSLGKQMLGLRVMTPAGEGCGWGRSVTRNAALILFPIEVFLVLRGLPRIGDRIARTTVTQE